MQNNEFSIEYVSPGIVRSGLCGMTDFGLIYKETGEHLHFRREACFTVEGHPAQDGRMKYTVRLPAEFRGVSTIPWFSEWKNLVIHRMTQHVRTDLRLLRMHGEISMEEMSH